MRNWFSSCIVALVNIICCSCTTTSFFNSPNHVQNIPGRLILSNGDTISGRISLNNEVLIHKEVKVVTDTSSEKFLLHDITGYQIDGNTYFLRHIMHGMDLSKNLFFMKRITPAASRIHLYEHMEKRMNHRSTPRVSYEPKYYIQFPNEHRYSVWALTSKRLVPNFHLKMSEIVEACKPLAEKIKNREKGYAYSQLNASEKERADVILKIINEFNYCKGISTSN